MSPPELPISTLQTALTSLTTATHILDGFAHRNKNQHRGTKWWASFATLRRNLHKLLPDLEGALQRAELVKARKTQPELQRVVERAAWVRDVVGVRAYSAFSQLAADNQFAHLGLALIGVLAQVNATLAPFLPEPELVEEKPMTAVVADSGVISTAPAIREAPASVDNGRAAEDTTAGIDLGVAISRDGLSGPDGEDDYIQPSIELRQRKARIETPHDRARDKRPLGMEEIKLKKRKKVKLDDEPLLGRDKDLAPKLPRADEKEAKKVKKKKKKKGGDEFDDLFSSLV